jgi:hypothetical protein
MRIGHAISYTLSLQPWRTISFLVSILDVVVIALYVTQPLLYCMSPHCLCVLVPEYVVMRLSTCWPQPIPVA